MSICSNVSPKATLTAPSALSNVTTSYVLALAERGAEGAMGEDPGLGLGLNVRSGEITHPAVIEALPQLV